MQYTFTYMAHTSMQSCTDKQHHLPYNLQQARQQGLFENFSQSHRVWQKCITATSTSHSFGYKIRPKRSLFAQPTLKLRPNLTKSDQGCQVRQEQPKQIDTICDCSPRVISAIDHTKNDYSMYNGGILQFWGDVSVNTVIMLRN